MLRVHSFRLLSFALDGVPDTAETVLAATPEAKYPI